MEQHLWFLNAAVEMRIDLDVLVSPVLSVALNRPSHGLDEEGILDALAALHERGWIEFVEVGGIQAWPDDEALRRALHGRERSLPRLWYGLTETGGKLWEERAAPRWDRFVTMVEDSDTLVAETTAMTRERVDAVSAFPQAYEVVQGADQWEELEPWEATYWKTLPHGVRVRRRIRPLLQEEAWRRAGGLKPWSQQRAELAMLLRWHDSPW